MRFVRLFAVLVGVLACFGPFGCHPGRAPRVLPDDPRFNDYSTPRIQNLAEFLQLAAVPGTVDDRPAVAGAKFVITDFSDPKKRKIHFLDGRYFQFHDEWAWFRLLNGQSVPGLPALELHPFKTPDQVRAWANQNEDALPDGLELIEGRLYIRQFYDLTLATHERELGAGSVVHVEARAKRPEVWGFEVDYTDPASSAELRVFFDELAKTIPSEAAAQLKWFARSPEQLAIGKRLEAEKPELAGRTITYGDVSIPGETAVYTSGVVVGRLRAFRELSHLADSDPEDILLLGALPEYLPQARGLVTAIPQTPLAHLNLLAKSRQIVNAYRGGVLEDPDVQDLVRSRAPVVVSAEQGQLKLKRITEEQYKAWQTLVEVPQVARSSAPLQSMPYVVELSQVQLGDLPKYAPLIGGKASGMVHLLRGLGPGTSLNGTGELHPDVPDRPLAITVRAYREHMAPLLPAIRELLADESFQKFKKLRVLALEGSKEFTKKFPSQRDRELAKSYEAPRAIGPIAAVVRQGGVQHMVRHTPLPEGMAHELERQLSQHFGTYAAEQGLRFRSSSTVEDIEGFNGAGLYASYTGYLAPAKAHGPEPKRASVADAVRKTWASYFSTEAFEERQRNHIDHLAADMAVLVHARFDDKFEQSNGVFTFSLTPQGGELRVDAQPGAVSVTNPPTDRVVIPESSRARRAAGASAGGGANAGEIAIERQTLSSLSKAGEHVLSDADLRELFGLAESLTKQHLERDNAGLADAQKRRVVVMDFEFRRVLPGWPALRQGQNPGRFVVKQMRPLEPSPRVGPALREAPIPHDVLARARRVETRTCRGEGLDLSVMSVFTDPDALPDVGYSVTPLVAGVGITYPGIAPRVFTHLEQRAAVWSRAGVSVELLPGFAIQKIEQAGDSATLTMKDGAVRRAKVSCEQHLDFAEPRDLLRQYLAAP